MKLIIAIIAAASSLFSPQKEDNNPPISLHGRWSVALDSLDIGESKGWTNQNFGTYMLLPGTTDDAGLGIADTLSPLLQKPQLLHLTRRHSYLGAAWYTRTFKTPQNSKGKHILLSLERVLWKSDVWIDGKRVESDKNSSLSTPHIYDVSRLLRPGKEQRITIRVDNRKQYDISYENMAHAYTDHTQIIWNGILGRIELQVQASSRIERIMTFPHIAAKNVSVKLDITSEKPSPKAQLTIWATAKKDGTKVKAFTQTINLKQGAQSLSFTYDMGSNIKLWSELSPNLYTLTAELKTPSESSKIETDFGMREIRRDGRSIILNNSPIFVRGTLECCIFPLKGSPPTTKEEWQKIAKTAKEWGLNHLRFHSWCPPQAAFQVADEEGLYIQVELPVWSLTLGKDKETTAFLHAEAKRIMECYGNHPSFCFWSMGNELQGDMQVPSSLAAELKKEDARHLYTTTSFTFEKGYGAAPLDVDDYLITQWTNDGWIRGQGVFNAQSPSFDKDYGTATRNIEKPIVTHEIGQYAVYPNIDEIKKYKGVLKPTNFEAIRADLIRKGMLDKAHLYTWASGKLASILYKEEIERALKSPAISGYQLLDLHDFPGQGTATVGLLDAFWDSKGIITPEEFREFCAPVVPLARFAKATYTSNERFIASIDISNFAEVPLNSKQISWILADTIKNTIAKGTFSANLKLGNNTSLDAVNVDLSGIKAAQKLTLSVSVEGTTYRNHWNIWVYPAIMEVNSDGIAITDNLDEALTLLSKGAKVLFNPDWKRLEGLEGKFVPVFWSPVHFPKQAGTMGILCKSNHPALSAFPNDGYSDWQWWNLRTSSTTLDIDSLKGASSIVDVIDNFTNNRRLSMVFEGQVGQGKLLVATCDLHNLSNRPAAKQLLYSLIEYMKSDKFAPSAIQNPEFLHTYLKEQTDSKKEDAKSIY